jgi:hypothetical protein
MKSFRILGALALASLVALSGIDAPAFGQAYPTPNPTYIPNAVLPASALTAAGDIYFAANGVAGATVRVSALTGTLVAAIQVSNDPLPIANASANWTTVQFLPIGGGAVATSITANGLYAFNTAGLTRFRIHVTTLSGGGATATFNAAASVGPALAYSVNPNSGTVNNGNLPYPAGAVPITASATGTTAATTATLAATTGKTTYLCGFTIRANATAAATGNATITGTITGTLNFTQFTAPLASGIGVVDPAIGANCIPASATNQAIAVISAAPGSGGTVSVSAWGYEL